MTRPYALCMLLEHGPLSWCELEEITGWTEHVVWRAIERCIKRGHVRRLNVPGFTRPFYELA